MKRINWWVASGCLILILGAVLYVTCIVYWPKVAAAIALLGLIFVFSGNKPSRYE